MTEDGRKNNTVMPKLILLYEDIKEEGQFYTIELILNGANGYFI